MEGRNERRKEERNGIKREEKDIEKEGIEPGGRGTSIYGLYRYVSRDRVGFLRFSILK